MAIIPVERRFTSGISTLKWHTRWSKDEKGADDGDDETGDEAKNWASGFIVFKVKLFSGSSSENPLRIVQTEAILYLKSMSERVGSDDSPKTTLP